MRLSISVPICLIASGCATAYDPGYPVSTISPDEVLKAVRCEFVSYVKEHKGRKFFLTGNDKSKNWTIQGSLQVKTTRGIQNHIGGKATIIPYQGPSPAFSLGLSMDSEISDARDTTTKFSLEPKIVDGGACVSSSGFGIASWLKAVDAAVGDPSGLPLREKSHSFGLTFGVLRGAQAQADVDLVIVPVNIDARTLSKRDDVQVLTLALAPIPPDEVIRVEVLPRQTRPSILPMEPFSNGSGGEALRSPRTVTRTIRRSNIPDLSEELDRKRRQLLAIE